MPSSHTFIAWFFPFRLRMVLLLIYMKLEGSRAFSGLLPPTSLFPVYFLLVRFIVRKISSVAAIACSVQVSFFGERGSSYHLRVNVHLFSSSYSSPAWQPILWQLIPEPFIRNLFRETLRLLFAAVIVAVPQFSLFPYLLGRAE